MDSFMLKCAKLMEPEAVAQEYHLTSKKLEDIWSSRKHSEDPELLIVFEDFDELIHFP